MVFQKCKSCNLFDMSHMVSSSLYFIKILGGGFINSIFLINHILFMIIDSLFVFFLFRNSTYLKYLTQILVYIFYLFTFDINLTMIFTYFLCIYVLFIYLHLNDVRLMYNLSNVDLEGIVTLMKVLCVMIFLTIAFAFLRM